jgi:hypothetical protein
MSPVYTAPLMVVPLICSGCSLPASSFTKPSMPCSQQGLVDVTWQLLGCI